MADWEVTIIPGGPQWCELFLILYRTPYSTKLKVNRTDAVTVCLFRILTIEQVLLDPRNIAKHLIVSTVLEYCDIRNTNSSMPPTTGSGRYTEILTGLPAAVVGCVDQSLFQHSGSLRCQLTYYAKLIRPLAVCIHKEGSNWCKV